MFQNNTTKILIYAYTGLPDHEICFWNRLKELLITRDIEFLLLGNCNDQKLIKKLNTPYVYINPILSFYGNSFPSFIHNNINNLNQILAVEENWHGVDDHDLRKNGAHYLKEFYTELLLSLNPKSCYIWSGEHSSELILRKQCAEVSCPVVFLERGPLPDTLQISDLGFNGGFNGSHPISKERTWQWENSELQLKWNRLYRSYANRILESYITWHPQPRCDEINFKIPSSKKIILFLNQLDIDTSSFYYSPFFKRNIDALSWLCKELETRNDIYIIGKQHPYNHSNPATYQNILGDKGIWTTTVSLRKCIEIADYVVAINSSALFEALIFNKAVLQLGISFLSRKNIVYELTNPKDSKKLITDWIEKHDLENRLRKWSDFSAYLFANNFYLMSDSYPHSNEFKNVVDISELITETIKSPPPNYQKLNLNINYCINRHKSINTLIFNEIKTRHRQLRYGGGTLLKRIIFCFPFPRRMARAIWYWLVDKTHAQN